VRLGQLRLVEIDEPIPGFSYRQGNGPFEVFVQGLPEGSAQYKLSDAYSDRMMDWDFEKFTRCASEAGIKGQYFSGNTPNQAQNFIRLYYNNPNLILVKVVQYNNAATGYPIWYFVWAVPLNAQGE
jgi:hypothetical protein